MSAHAGYSVVIPTFNRAWSVSEAIRSALAQNGVRVEVLVADDGSTDNTLQVLAEIGDSRLRWLALPHAGRCAARNAGARAASFPWLVFLDSDDVLLPGALAGFDRARTDGVALAVAPSRRVVDGSDSIHFDLFWKQGARLPWGMQAGGFAIQQSLFWQLGGYCTDLDHSEHTELALRLRRIVPTPRVALVTSPTVEVRVRRDRYDPAVQYRSAVHLLDHAAVELADDREARALQLGVAGEAARRLGRRSESVRLLARAFAIRPGGRSAARLFRAIITAGGDGT